ncbi:hypothetical protein Leryth_008916 [Lithospermum erythrorhizon]|nr:hypothetical protein Leryth_008916 [Lithospermum erythrorhizon]
MGKGKTRAVEKGVIGQQNALGVGTSSSLNGSLDIPSGPVYYPNEEEFKDPLSYIYKIRPEAEKYGICKIVPPESWKPPFALDLDSFTFPTKTQAIHQLQARVASCDSKTFNLEYCRFLTEQQGKKVKKRVLFEGEELDLCKLFNAVKRFGGYDKVVEEKKWGEVFRFVNSSGKIRQCAKHVLCQLYREHLYDYEEYYNKLNKVKKKNLKRRLQLDKNFSMENECPTSKRRRKNNENERLEVQKVEKEEHDQICEQCESGLHEEVMLLCDRCNKGWHLYCLSPPLKQVPPGNWYCLDCLNSEKDSFGFVPGKNLSLDAFRRMADRTRKKWFGSASTSRVQLEKKFWEIVEGSIAEVEVMYGSDLDTSVLGSGFPRISDSRPSSIEPDIWDEYCSSPWNLNNLPKLQGSVLRTVHQNITGVMVPWLYIGMLFSSFCWHVEDHCFYSMNYHHWGEPKCWYSVPADEADAFEKVMRKSLPDLFDAQPDLLFQLVTMLSPSVLQKHNVPVYSILQEPGNFIITFPRSYHAGFNFGLNCAEAVNFAPADWLPYGGFGANLYKIYHKTPVLSHEELLCVVAKNNYDNEVSPYLRKELLRVYIEERTWREKLWKNGVVNSKPMPLREKPDFVGTEEDPTCIICQQLLYLSAVACNCRPTALVCLEHWQHICECKPNKHTLLYRLSLGKLGDLARINDKESMEAAARSRKQESSPGSSAGLSRKVKGVFKTHSELAEEWLRKACKIFQMPYSVDVYDSTLKEAEQFLWAGSEMNSVRGMAKRLVKARDWAESVRDCLSKADTWISQHNRKVKNVSIENLKERVTLERVNKLLDLDSFPCNESSHLKLKGFQMEARLLIQEIRSTLLVCSKVTMADLEMMFSKMIKLPIHTKESERLYQIFSSAKVWARTVRRCTSERSPASVEANFLFELKAEMKDLQIQLPEGEILLDLVKQVESCRSRCNHILKGPITMKEVKQILDEFDGFTVNIEELNLLRQYHAETIAWVTRVNNVLMNIHEREDQEFVVDELTNIYKDGLSLKIEVEDLPRIDNELQKASWRVQAQKALSCKMSMDCVQALMQSATILQIDQEKLFTDISGVCSSAVSWEKRAKQLLACEAEMPEFEDILRSSEDICVILPSLNEVKDIVSTATAFLNKSKPFLFPNLIISRPSNALLGIDTLKDLVSESELLKVSLTERFTIRNVLKRFIELEQDACSLLHEAENLLNIENRASPCLVLKLERQVYFMKACIEAGQSLAFDFGVIPNFLNACSTLNWCFKALSFCGVIPEMEEVETSLDNAGNLPTTYLSSPLFTSLVDGINSLKKCLAIARNCQRRQFKFVDAEEALKQAQKQCVPFPLVENQLQQVIQKHSLWLEQAFNFFSLDSRSRSLAMLLKLKELGSSDTFNCAELDRVFSEAHKLEIWIQKCWDYIKPSAGDSNQLLSRLTEVEASLDRSLNIYMKSKCAEARASCTFCFADVEDQTFHTCYICKDRFHLHCLGQSVSVGEDLACYECTYCISLTTGKIPKSGFGPLRIQQTCPELSNLSELLSNAEDLCLWTDERSRLHQVVEKATECQACLSEIVEFALAYIDDNLEPVMRKLSVALKAVDLASVSCSQGNSRLDLALARNSWKIRAQKLLGGSLKPTIQQIQRLLKEGRTVNIPLEDCFSLRLTKAKNDGNHWVEKAKKVSMDGGALGLDKVFELIAEGENLPLQFDKELALLRERSMLYCICRRPYDQRPMVACDKCDEWYHFDCVNLATAPKVYICPACDLQVEEYPCSPLLVPQDRSSGYKFVEPQTPSPRNRSSGLEQSFRRSRKPMRRVARKRLELGSLSPFIYAQNS